MRLFCKDCGDFLPQEMFDKQEMLTSYGKASICKWHKSLRELDKRSKKYNITGIEVWRMVQKQEGMCDICSSTFVPWTKFHIDHCHDSGKVRGLLCHNCNIGLGMFKDNKESLSKAIKYLDKE
jgi:hypothetical protein